MDNVINVVVSSAGGITANGQPITLEELAPMLAALKAAGGGVWYHRENPAGEPHENAMKVIDLVCQNKLPVRMFVRPDFSDKPETALFGTPPSDPPPKEKSARTGKNPRK